MRIAICDDGEKYIYQVKELIEHLYHSLEILIDTYQNGNELLSKYDKYSYDVVILDIEMPTVNGISQARKLRQKSEEVVLIFLTGHVEYALQGYEVNALRACIEPWCVWLSAFNGTLRIWRKNAGMCGIIRYGGIFYRWCDCVVKKTKRNQRVYMEQGVASILAELDATPCFRRCAKCINKYKKREKNIDE